MRIKQHNWHKCDKVLVRENHLLYGTDPVGLCGARIQHFGHDLWVGIVGEWLTREAVSREK
jgi:hypothetical protein